MTARKPLPKRLARRVLLLLSLVCAASLLWLRRQALTGPEFGLAGSNDFVQYWSAARLVGRGGNPYDPAALLAVERSVGWPAGEPLLMWNPPWALALVLPVAALPFNMATTAWLVLQVGLVLFCGGLLWHFFVPGDRRLWIGLLLAAGFVPALLALRMGQISPWLLAGVTGFLWAARARRDALAGAALALLAIKPHVAYLFLLAALWWAWRSRRPRVLAGFLGTLAGATALVLLFNPDLLGQYLAAAANPPLYWATPTLGGWLRLAFGSEHRWLQFLPSLLGGLILIAWLSRAREPWDWRQVAPPLLLLSVVTSAYGWSHDQVVLLPVVVVLADGLRHIPTLSKAVALAIFALAQCGLVVLSMFRWSEIHAVWLPLALAGLYIGFLRLPRSPTAQSVHQRTSTDDREAAA